MKMVLRELRRNSKSFIIWTVSIAALIAMVMAVFPSVARESANYDQMVKQLPEAFSKAFSLDRLSMSDIMGFYGTEAGIMILLGGGIFSALLGSGILFREESEKTVEFLLSKPVTRNQVVTGKLLGCLIYIVLFNLLITLTSLICFELVKTADYSQAAFWLLALGEFLVQLTFASIGFLASIFFRKKRASSSFGIGFVLLMYFISTISALNSKIEFLKYFTPFKYADTADIIINKSLGTTNVIILLAINVAAIGLAYILYNRKNISI